MSLIQLLPLSYKYTKECTVFKKNLLENINMTVQYITRTVKLTQYAVISLKK